MKKMNRVLFAAVLVLALTGSISCAGLKKTGGTVAGVAIDCARADLKDAEAEAVQLVRTVLLSTGSDVDVEKVLVDFGKSHGEEVLACSLKEVGLGSTATADTSTVKVSAQPDVASRANVFIVKLGYKFKS